MTELIKKGSSIRKLLYIGISTLVTFGILLFASNNISIERTKIIHWVFDSCLRKTGAEVLSGEYVFVPNTSDTNTFAYWDLSINAESATYEEMMQFSIFMTQPREKSYVYTNALEITFSTPFYVYNPTTPLIDYFNGLKIDTTLGNVSNIRIVKSESANFRDSNGCALDKYYLQYDINLPDVNLTNQSVEVGIKFSLGDKKYDRKYTVNNVVWTDTELVGITKERYLHPSEADWNIVYKVPEGQDIKYRVTLKTPMGLPLRNQKLGLANPKLHPFNSRQYVKNFTQKTQFVEVSPGVYESTVQVEGVGTFAISPSISDQMPNPGYSLIFVEVH
ncbi:MAG: hypothetical protein AAB445_00405 [Patescibacteria group bacterium]